MIDNQAVLAMVARVKDEIAQAPHDNIMSFEQIPIHDMQGTTVVYSRRDLKDAVERLMASHQLVSERDITSDKPGFKGKLITALKKVARKSLRFYVQPICEQQSEFNHMTACGFRQFSLGFTEIAPDREKLQDNARRLRRLEQKMREWKARKDETRA